MKAAAIILVAAFGLMGADPSSDEGRREETRACLPCHSLRIIHVQRLSRGAWEKELDKMERWGAVIKDRNALLDYLVANFNERVPPASIVQSPDGRKQASK